MQEPQFTISDKIIKFPEFSLIALQSNFHIFQQFRFGPKFLENLGMHLYSKLLTHNSPYLITEVRVLSSKNVLEDLQQGLSSKTGHQGRTSNSASNWSFLAEFPRSISSISFLSLPPRLHVQIWLLGRRFFELILFLPRPKTEGEAWI